MRKSAHRTPRPLARFLTFKQHRALALLPSMALQLLKAGSATREHWVSLIGFFNIGIALAFLEHNNEFIEQAQEAQDFIVALEPDDNNLYALPQDERTEHVMALFNAIEYHLKTQHYHVVEKALVYINRALDGKESSADVVRLADMLQQETGRGSGREAHSATET